MLNDLKIRTGMLLVLVLMTVALLACALTGWKAASDSEKQILDLHEISIERSAQLQKAYARLLRVRVAMAGAFLEGQAGEQDKARISMQLSESLFQEAKTAFGLFKTGSSNDVEWQRFEQELDVTYAGYHEVLIEQLQALKDNSQSRYIEVNLKAREANNRFDKTVISYEQQVEQHINGIMTDAHGRYQLAQVEALVLLVVTVLLSLGCWWFIARHVLKPLSEAGKHFELMAIGDLSASIEIRSSNEIGLLFASLKRMQQSQRETIGRITNSANQLTSAA